MFSQVLWLPKHCVFIGCWLLEGPGNSKTLCLHRFSGSSGALGAPKPYVFIEALAPRGPWNSKALCHKFLSASRGAGELQNRMSFFTGFRAPRGLCGLQTLRFSHVIWLLGCPGAPTPYVIGFRTPRVTWGLQTLGFTSCLARRGHWGSKTYCFHWWSGFSEAVGAPKPYVFHTYSGSSGDLGALKSGVFISVRAPRGPWGGTFGSSGALGAPKSNVFTSCCAPQGPWEPPKPCIFHRCSGSSGGLGAQ